ncbi:MAG TPA: hypothetical protein VG370_33605 [Chloroflexota bacterium]|nr:hypothetical protein [Chloroflexota bacterium]
MEIARLRWRPDNERKLIANGVAPWEADELVETGDWAVTVHPDYPDQVRIIGPASAGCFVTIALEPTANPAVWRPVTGWPSTAGEIAYYRREQR